MIPYFFAVCLDMGRFMSDCFERTWINCSDSAKKRMWKRKVSVVKSPIIRRNLATSYSSRRWLPLLIGTVLTVIYLCVLAGILLALDVEGWSYFDYFYFIFQTITLIGFGDLYPQGSYLVLEFSLLILGAILLISMCFFIMQETIIEQAHQATWRVKQFVGSAKASKLVERNRTVNQKAISKPKSTPGILWRRQSQNLPTMNGVQNVPFVVVTPPIAASRLSTIADDLTVD